MKFRRFASLVITISLSLSLFPTAISFADETEVAVGAVWKFDFGAEGQTAAEGYKSVTPATEYRKNIDGTDQYGLIGSSPDDYKFPDYEDGVVTKQGQYYSYAAAGEGIDADDDRIGIGTLPDTTPAQIEGLYPIRFSMAAENNAYYEVKVTVTGFDSTVDATATVYSEKRHPIITNKSIAAGEKEIVEFTATPQKVLVKDRTNGGSITYNDNKLNVEVVGENVAISSIEVKKVNPKTAIWCYDDSTGCDYAMSLPYFPLQNYGGTAQYLSKYLSKDIALVNQGDGGIAANALGYFNCAKDNIKEGDYIYMQYGHNHKKDGPVGYVTWMHYYYEHAHEKGANMIFAGPIDRHKSSQYDTKTNTFNSTLNGFSKAADYYTQLLITRGFDTAQEFAAKAKAKGGAGQCLGDSHRCVFGKDGFTDAQEKIREADAVAFISPVYWEEVSEGLKSFMDRFCRCESSGIFNQRKAALTGKPVLLVVSAGGSSLDMIEPLKEMEHFVHHTGGRVFDAIGVNRWNQAYKGNTIYEAAKAMAEGVKVGEAIPFCRI